MGIKIKDVPLSGLLALQQVTELASREMHGFFQQVLEDHKKQIVSTSYFDALEIKLESKVKNNNEVCDMIEKETFKRLQSVFGSKATTPKIMTTLVRDYEAEKAKNSQLLKKNTNPEKDVIPLDTGTSSEKKV